MLHTLPPTDGPHPECDARDRGVSLVEILVTIVVLGILASAATLAVRGTTSTAEASACSADRATLERAAAAWRTHHQDEPLSVDRLVSDQFLRGPSELHELSADGTVVPRGKCSDATAADIGASAGPEPVTPAPPSGTVPTSAESDDADDPGEPVRLTRPGNPSVTNPGRPNPANGGR